MSRYPTPGSVIHAMWEPSTLGGYISGLAVVMATSRHRKHLTRLEARLLLIDAYGDNAVDIERVGIWRTNLASQADDLPAEFDVGGWSEEGAGQAWVKVAYPLLPAKIDEQREASRG